MPHLSYEASLALLPRALAQPRAWTLFDERHDTFVHESGVLLHINLTRTDFQTTQTCIDLVFEGQALAMNPDQDLELSPMLVKQRLFDFGASTDWHDLTLKHFRQILFFYCTPSGAARLKRLQQLAMRHILAQYPTAYGRFLINNRGMVVGLKLDRDDPPRPQSNQFFDEHLLAMLGGIPLFDVETAPFSLTRTGFMTLCLPESLHARRALQRPV